MGSGVDGAGGDALTGTATGTQGSRASLLGEDLLRQLDHLDEHPNSIDEEMDAVDDDDEPFDPDEFDEEDDDF